MKIAFIKQKYVPFGGGEGYLENLMTACVKRGHDVHLITTKWPGEELKPVTCRVVPMIKLTRATRMRSFSKAAAAAVRAGDYDVSFSLDRTEHQDIWRAGEGVHSVWLDRRRLFEPGWKVQLAKWSSGQRAILDLERRCVSGSVRIIANSRMVQDDLAAAYGVGPEKVVLIPNGIDLRRFNPQNRVSDRAAIRAELGLSESDKVILFVGSNFLRKGVRETIQVLTRVKDAVLVVLGRDDSKPWRQFAENCGVADRVRFPGTRKDIPRLYRAADVTAFATWFDSFGFVGIESMACGTPLVTTGYSGVSQALVPGVNGELVSRPDALAELAAALERQLSRHIDEAEAARISGTVKDYSLEFNVDRTARLIESVGQSHSK